jgi:hypothetical protein
MSEASNREWSLLKRSSDLEQNLLPSKRTKCDLIKSDEQYDSSTTDTDTESKCSSSDINESEIEQNDDNSDIEDTENDTNISTDQSRYIPVVLNEIILQQQKQCLSRHSKKLIKKFKYIYNHSKRKVIEPTQCINDNINEINKLRWELRNSFNRIDLFKEGYAVLSDESFPFYSLCYMVSIERYFPFN